MKDYFSIQILIKKFINVPFKNSCLKILEENLEKFKSSPGSTNNHQAWTGGYLNHICEVMNIGKVLYDSLNSLRVIPFSLSDVLLILFLHDLEKPWKYDIDESGELHVVYSMRTKDMQHQFRMNKLKEYGIELNDYQMNAFQYVEGELNDYSSRKRVMNELAALCHMADVASARIWYNHPGEIYDEWSTPRKHR